MDNCRAQANSANLALRPLRGEREAMKIGAHERVTEYDGAYWCTVCSAKWGALTGHPAMPDTCVAMQTPYCADCGADDRAKCPEHTTPHCLLVMHLKGELATALERESGRTRGVTVAQIAMVNAWPAEIETLRARCECPIGITQPEICSAGTCYVCLAKRTRELEAELLTLRTLTRKRAK